MKAEVESIKCPSHLCWLLCATVLISLVWLSAPDPLFSQNDLDHVTRLPFVSRNHFGFQVTWASVSRVIDGDTIELAGGARVRYIGIDTPGDGSLGCETMLVI